MSDPNASLFWCWWQRTIISRFRGGTVRVRSKRLRSGLGSNSYWLCPGSYRFVFRI